MREILFRGKRNDNGEWIIGGYYHGEVYNLDEIDIHYIIPCCDLYDEDLELVEVIPETVGQYTGLTDNNGERIWEGDIVRCKQERGNEGICVVIWFNGAFVACPISGNLLEMTLHDYWYNDYDLVEIIGNETDNPELLKGE